MGVPKCGVLSDGSCGESALCLMVVHAAKSGYLIWSIVLQLGPGGWDEIGKGTKPSSIAVCLICCVYIYICMYFIIYISVYIYI